MEHTMGFQADSSTNSFSNLATRPEDWLAGGGEMGKLIRSMDWTNTPLGPIESWPQSLRTTVSLCLASNFPIALVWGPKHVQIYNDGYWPICGEKHPSSMGQDFTECWAAPWPVIGDVFERALAGETSFLENQRMFLDRNGYLEETFFTFSFSPIRDDSGVAGLFHPVIETTSRMLSERRTRALRDLAARSGKAKSAEEACELAAHTLAEYQLDLPFVLVYLFDKQAKEARLVAAHGLPRESVAVPAIVNLGVSEGCAWPLAEVARTGRTQHVNDLEARFGRLSCGEYPESLKEALALPITPPGCEKPVGVLVAGVSCRLALNEAYRTFYDLLAATITTEVANARAYEEERKRAEALAEIDRAKTAFFSNVSHEFRTPLTLMLGPLEDELAERANPLPQARRERLETAHRNSLRLLKLVNTLLDFSRIEAGRVQAKYEPTDLAEYTAELASVFRSAIEKAGLILAIDCPALPEPIYVDHGMWEKIVLNLLSNAFKHTFKGCITVKLSWCGDHIELAVTDSGVGISEAELPHLFERFHRVEGARSRSNEGTGIGLALVKELVSLHGGTIHVESEEDKGSIFTVAIKAGTAHVPSERLSLSAKHDLASIATRGTVYVGEALQWLPNAETPSDLWPRTAQADAVDPHSGPNAVSTARRARILWADDNADMRDYVRRLLADSYDVVAVPDGLTALSKAREELPDLVLSDIMMPGLDGFGLLRELRSDPRTQAIPIILLSARAGEESSVEGLNAGADDYLVKPFSAKELLARLRTHLDLARIRGEWAREVEALNVDLERRVSQRTEALRQSEQQLRLLISGVKDYGIFMLDPDGHIKTWNLGCQRLKGWSAEEVIGHHFSRFYSPEEVADRLPQRELEIAKAEGQFTGEGWRIRKDGSRFWASLVITPILGDHGSLLGFSKVTRDTTERRRIEQAMKEEEARLAAVIGSAMDAVITVDEHQVITLFNPAAEKMFGYSSELVLGRPLDQLIPERFRADHASHIQKFARTDVSRRKMGALISIYGLRSDGQEFPIEASISQARIGGQLILSVILRDISERNRTEEVLRQHASLLDVAPVLVRDMEDRIVFWSAGLAKLYNYSRQEAEGRVSHDFLQTQFPEPLKQIQQKLDSTGSWEGELLHRDRDGKQVVVNSQWVLDRDSHGKPMRILELNADITAKKHAESLQLRSQKLESLGTLSGGIAHDFNNILLAITGNAKLAISDLPPDHPVQQSLAEIAKAGSRATDLVRRILTFSRPGEMKRQVVDLQPVVEEALKLVRATLPATIEFRTSFAANLPAALADSTQIHQIIVNLATNAAHAIGGRSDGVIEVQLDTARLTADDASPLLNLSGGNYVRLYVRDNGCGMDRPTLDRIFDPFFTTKGPGEGTGLGLAVVHGIMKNHDGGIAVYSEPGRGTAFRLFFPAAASAAAKVAEAQSPKQREHSENILYVDDEEALVMLVTRTLKRLGYKVTGETDPFRAIELFRSNPRAFDIVVTDLAMPQLSGFDLSSQLLAIRPDVPVIMTSGFVRPEDQERALQMGVRDLILKPDTIDELGRALDRVFLHQLS
jgi:PAS domain S-box-containing protein